MVKSTWPGQNFSFFVELYLRFLGCRNSIGFTVLAAHCMLSCRGGGIFGGPDSSDGDAWAAAASCEASDAPFCPSGKTSEGISRLTFTGGL